MQANIHPTYHQDTPVTCSCGNKFTTGSVLDKIDTDICSACHPFFTGEMKFVDTQGRVEKFEEARKRAQALQKTQSKSKKQGQDDDDNDDDPKTLKEIMQEMAKGQAGN